jgi:hypothetical protein
MSLIDTHCQFRQALGCPLIVFAPMSYAATDNAKATLDAANASVENAKRVWNWHR